MKKGKLLPIILILALIPLQGCGRDKEAEKKGPDNRYFGRVAKQFKQKNVQTSELADVSSPIVRRVTGDDVLYVSYVVSPKLFESDAEGATYEFEILAQKGLFKKRLHREKLDPKRKGDDRGWKNVMVPLDGFAGSEIKLHFKANRIAPNNWKRPAEGLYWGGLRVGNFNRKPGEYNVILISIDTLRADHLSSYGYHRKTETIDGIASKGVLFKQAISQSSWTKPAHMSMMTGLLPSFHKMWLPSKKDRNRQELSRDIPTLAEILRTNGYITQAFTGSGYTSARFGFARGFDRYQEFGKKYHGDGPFVFNGAASFIKKNRKQKMFLFMHTFEVHTPYRHRKYLKGERTQEGDSLIDKYDSCIFYVDQMLKRLGETLREAGLMNDTLIILTSDHGEELRERGFWPEHSHTMYDELIRVPMIFSLPARFKPRVVDNYQSQHVDFLPTILDTLSIPRENIRVQGRSLLDILQGGPVPAQSIAVSEGTVWGSGDLRSVRMIDGRRYKLIYSPYVAGRTGKWGFSNTQENRYWIRHLIPAGGVEFFDLTADPKERRSLARAGGAIFRKLMDFLKEHLASIPDVAGAPTEIESDDEEIDRHLEEQLRSLGY